MKPIPVIPVFTAIDAGALRNADWTSKATAIPVLDTLKIALQHNVGPRVTYLRAALEAATDRIRIMQDGVEAMKKNRPSPAEIDTDVKLKAVRDEVKQLMDNAKTEEQRYFDAMGDFRNMSFDFAGEFKDYLGKVRTTAQNGDKEVAPVSPKLVSLEGFASALIKQLRELRGEMAGNMERREKIEAIAKKMGPINLEAGTAMMKVASGLRSIENLLPRLPGSQGELQTRTKDITNAYGRFTTAMGAMSTARKSIDTMIKSFTGHGYKEATKPQLKEIEGYYATLITERDKVQKQLDAIRKEKALPSDIRKALPETL